MLRAAHEPMSVPLCPWPLPDSVCESLSWLSKVWGELLYACLSACLPALACNQRLIQAWPHRIALLCNAPGHAGVHQGQHCTGEPAGVGSLPPAPAAREQMSCSALLTGGHRAQRGWLSCTRCDAPHKEGCCQPALCPASPPWPSTLYLSSPCLVWFPAVLLATIRLHPKTRQHCPRASGRTSVRPSLLKFFRPACRAAGHAPSAVHAAGGSAGHLPAAGCSHSGGQRALAACQGLDRPAVRA